MTFAGEIYLEIIHTAVLVVDLYVNVIKIHKALDSSVSIFIKCMNYICISLHQNSTNVNMSNISKIVYKILV